MLKGSQMLMVMHFVKAKEWTTFISFFQLDADGGFFYYFLIRFDLEFSQVSGLKCDKMFMESRGVNWTEQFPLLIKWMDGWIDGGCWFLGVGMCS